MSQQKFEPPAPDKNHYHCPHCNVFAHQVEVKVRRLAGRGGWAALPFDYTVRQCVKCEGYCFWIEGRLRYPDATSAPMPHDDTPEEIIPIYKEARAIVDQSPRAACALLRLCIEMLATKIVDEDKGLYQNIRQLVADGLDPTVQKSLDAVRVIGNDAVHPREISLADNKETAEVLFNLFNVIVDRMIAHPKRVNEVYELVPEHLREQIERDDAASATSADD